MTPETTARVRVSSRRADRIREFILGHLPDNMDVDVVITNGVQTAAVLPADVDALVSSNATEFQREQAEQLLGDVDADYLVLVTGNEADLDRIPLNDQLTADHAHQFGLAFHELLHILKTAIVTIGRLISEEIDERYHQPVHDLINIIEDGAIESEAVNGRHFSDNAGIRLELTRRIHSLTPADIPDGEQIEFSFWDAVTSTLYDAAIYPTEIPDVLLDLDNGRIKFKSDADRQAFDSVHDDLKRLAADALSITSTGVGDTTQTHDKHASVLRAKRVIETWRTTLQPLLESRLREPQERTGEAQPGIGSDAADQEDESGTQSRSGDSAGGFDNDDGTGVGETASEPGGTDGPEPQNSDHLSKPVSEDIGPSKVTVVREATADPYQDIFEQPAVTPDPDPDEVSDVENVDAQVGGDTDNETSIGGGDGESPGVEDGSPDDGDGDPDTADSEGDEGATDQRPETRTQALASAIERARERESEQSGSDSHQSASSRMDGGQRGSDGQPSSRDQLTFDEFGSDTTGVCIADEDSEGPASADVEQTGDSEVEPAETVSESPDSSGKDSEPEGEVEPEPIGPAHGRSPSRTAGEDRETFQEELDADRRAAHDEAARESVDREALERELENLGRSLERENRQVGEEVDEGSPGGSSGGPGSLDGIDLLPVSDALVPPGEWAAIEDGAHQVAATLEKELRLERQQGERTGLTAGTYDTRAGHRLVIGDPRVCKSRTPGHEKRYALVLVLDRSGSMREGTPPKVEVATQALSRFAVAAEALGIEVAIIDFIHGQARLVKPFAIETRHVQSSLLDVSCGGGTPLADAIGLAIKLVEVQRDDPLIVTVTDDEPRSVDAVINQLRESPAPVCSLTIATDSPPGTLSPDASKLAPYYERQAAVYSPDRLAERLDQFASLLTGF